MIVPDQIETIVHAANLEVRNHGGNTARAVDLYKSIANYEGCHPTVRGALVSEWAQLVWKIEHDDLRAREVFESSWQRCLSSRHFWIRWFDFELALAPNPRYAGQNHANIHKLYLLLRENAELPPITLKDISHRYMTYLLEYAPPGAIFTFEDVDREINGSFSIQTASSARLSGIGSVEEVHRRIKESNGHPGIQYQQFDDGSIIYDRYLEQQGGKHQLMAE